MGLHDPADRGVRVPAGAQHPSGHGSPTGSRGLCSSWCSRCGFDESCGGGWDPGRWTGAPEREKRTVRRLTPESTDVGPRRSLASAASTLLVGRIPPVFSLLPSSRAGSSQVDFGPWSGDGTVGQATDRGRSAVPRAVSRDQRFRFWTPWRTASSGVLMLGSESVPAGSASASAVSRSTCRTDSNVCRERRPWAICSRTRGSARTA